MIGAMNQDPEEGSPTSEQARLLHEILEKESLVPQSFVQGMAECERGEVVPLFEEGTDKLNDGGYSRRLEETSRAVEALSGESEIKRLKETLQVTEKDCQLAWNRVFELELERDELLDLAEAIRAANYNEYGYVADSEIDRLIKEYREARKQR